MEKENLFNEEEGMTRMTFGEHLEDLRRRLIFALIGFVPGVVFGLFVGWYVLAAIKDPAEQALINFYKERDHKKLEQLAMHRKMGLPVETKPIVIEIEEEDFRNAVRQIAPDAEIPEPPDPPEGDEPDRRTIKMKARVVPAEIESVIRDQLARMRILTLTAMEGFMAYMKVSLITGLVVSSWWVIYQLWQFVAEGLYRNERKVIYRAMPLSAALFLVGVAFCFYVVLPVVLSFCFGFNAWLDIEPNIRLSDWLGFATILPVIFGICFELPLVMLVLESVGIFSIDDYINRWKHAVMGIAILAMVVTPTTDPGSMMLLMGPMGGLYFLGIGLVQMRRGGLRALSPVAKLRALTGIVVSLYLIGVSVGFVCPAKWFPDGWWQEHVWQPGTLPLSWLLRSKLEAPSANWLWAVTLLNAGFVALIVLRAGELLMRLMGRRTKSA